MRISLNGADWLVQGWVPLEWELVGVTQIVTANLDIGKMLHGETGVLPSSVPGCAQADLLRNGVIKDPCVDLNSRDCEWAMHRNWLYRKRFSLPPEARGRKLRLIFHGIDYSARVWLNGELLGRHSGTFIPAEFDITHAAKLDGENLLALMFDPAPDEPAQVGYSNLVRALKPRFAYKWDFTTRLVQLGIWDNVEIAATGPAHIDDVWVRSTTDPVAAQVNVRTRIASAETATVSLKATLRLGGEIVAEGTQEASVAAGGTAVDAAFTIPNPRLWWPNDLGDQPLYSAEVTVAGPDGSEWDRRSTTFGLREIRMVQNDGAPPGADPYTMVVNGRKVFLRGWNFVPVDHCYGLPNTEKYEWLVELARRAHVNILRVWGGGIIEKEVFYDLCDRAGIIVWQEMPQSSSGLSNEPPVDAEFLATLRATARAALRRRRNHPCLAIWCGGNELARGLEPLDITHPNLAAIAEVVREEAPHLVYRPTSPYGPAYDPVPERFGRGLHHDVHGPWKYQGTAGQYRLFNANDCLFHSEAGAEGCACTRSIRRCLPNQFPWPADATNRAWVHHAGWWVNADVIRELFGELRGLDAFVMASQFVQAEALRYVIESNRRRKFRCGGSMLWQMNEPWPNVSATTAVDYYGVPKPAYYFVQRACAPRHVSLKYSRLDRRPGEEFRAEVFAHNSLGPMTARVGCRILDARGEQRFEHVVQRLEVPANSCVSAGEITWRIAADATVFIVRLELQTGGSVAAWNEYLFPVGGSQPLAPLAALPRTHLGLLDVRQEGERHIAHIRNDGEWAALMTMLEPDQATRLIVEDNVRTLLPGEVGTFAFTARRMGEAPEGTLIYVRAWNAETRVFNI